MNTLAIRRRRSAPSRLCLGLALVIASTLTALPVHADRVIGPGQEARVLALFAPATLGDEVVEGFRLTDVAIEARQIRLRLVSTSAPSVTLGARLVAHEQAVDGGVPVASSPSFVVMAAADVSDEQRAALLQLATRIGENDDGRFWTEVASEAPAAARESTPLRVGPLARLLLLAAAVIVPLVVLERRRRGRAKKPT